MIRLSLTKILNIILLILTKIYLRSRHGITGSKATLYRKKSKEVETQKGNAKLFQIFRKEVVQKCFIDQEVLKG